MLPLNLYARVRNFLHHCTRDRGCSAHPVFPAPSLLIEGKRNANLGQIMPRERSLILSRHPRALVIAAQAGIQYSRDSRD